ncbi:sensor histidine kinase [Roseococcus pinisoli]|uniref:histidine kinase n=1 Tax=Roseococcus pinisoli TaxID=2835040 RepID=A0ABS5QBI4_9PROT|nr:HAMP domain-containing sensor histidine kinase [Roseococcus pinisoli]MBS7810611.1 HAMP domain-containing histidine kinase [Roseococcus pinisoli]
MNSVTRRLVILTTLWVSLGLGMIAWFVVRTDEQQIQSTADARLASLLDAVVASTSFEPSSGPILTRPLADPEFERPLSGHYWQLTGPGGVQATSRSLWDSRLGPPLPTAAEGVRARNMQGPRGEELRVLERDVQIDSRFGRVPIAVQVAFARQSTDDEIAELRGNVILAFALLGTGLVVVVALLVVWGLRPLRRTQQELAEVRQGRRLHIDVAAPREIAPLVREIEALIEQNRATVERARNHVGNLAHALKTPIAVLRNALETGDVAVARSQSTTLERLVQHHLRRARAGALAGSAGAESAPLAIAEALGTALRRLTAARGVEIRVSGESEARVRADSQDLTEMLGNLMENASKYGNGRVAVRVSMRDPQHVVILVEDDGPGLADGEDGAALLRGVRLDEAKSGSGLGLAIVGDLASLYDGTLSLDRSGRLGGLAARLELPGRLATEGYQGPD